MLVVAIVLLVVVILQLTLSPGTNSVVPAGLVVVVVVVLILVRNHSSNSGSYLKSIVENGKKQFDKIGNLSILNYMTKNELKCVFVLCFVY